MTPALSITVDTSNLMAALTIMQQYSRHTPAESLNRTALFVLRKTLKLTPAASISRIDTSLMVETSPAVLKSGKLSRNKKRQNEVVTESMFRPTAAPLAALIINASVIRPDIGATPSAKRYNQRTGFRWARMQSPFRGVPRAAGAAAMRAAISRMTKSRHSSTHFLQATIGLLIRMLLPFVPAGYRGGASAGPGKDTNPDLGEVTPAVGGSTTATCVIENKLGMSGMYGELDARRNAAMHRIVGPILQGVIDREAAEKFAIIATRGWDQYKPRLAAHGVIVTN